MIRLHALPSVLLTLAALALSCGAGGCGATPHQIVHVPVVGAGVVANELRAANLRAYTDAATEVRLGLRDAGASASYPAAIAPYDREFDARTRAVAAISASLYALAACNDAVPALAPAALRQCAATALDAIERDAGSLSDGNVLPPVAIPPSFTAAVAALRAFVGMPARDAGEDGDSRE